MAAVRILTDSTADLPPELITREQITVVPLMVTFDDAAYRDSIDLTSDQLFALVDETGRLPKTSAPSPGAFQAAFAEATVDGSQALYIGLSSRLSSTIQNAGIAAAAFPAGQVHIFDSGSLCTGIGLQVLLACDLARQGKTAEEIVALLAEVQPRVRGAFLVDTLDYLHMGGRCSSTQALFGSLLKLRPVIGVADGGMHVAAKIRGARRKGMDWMLEQLDRDVQSGQVRTDRVVVAHTGQPDDVAYMVSEVRRILPAVQDVIVTRAGCVISSHCGPNTVGLFYIQ